ncbi:MAG: BrxA/BrxB family bacilliredoxin [Planctomycetes bacterium]|nr:BrxA/BrxB family bacilliredoxin [Planctomycetota bacterium]
MPYDPTLVQPMRDELVQAGVQELRSGSDVENWMKQNKGTALLVINSVCGCAAGMARPGVRLALKHGKKPDRVATVFAGQDTEATQKARSYFADVPPSSPSMALFKDGELVHFVPRHMIEDRSAQAVAQSLTAAFDQFCAAK